jgi:hypothetical protein
LNDALRIGLVGVTLCQAPGTVYAMSLGDADVGFAAVDAAGVGVGAGVGSGSGGFEHAQQEPMRRSAARRDENPSDVMPSAYR